MFVFCPNLSNSDLWFYDWCITTNICIVNGVKCKQELTYKGEDKEAKIVEQDWNLSARYNLSTNYVSLQGLW